MTSVVFAGVGGQGVLTAGLILGNVSLKGGKQVTWVPAYGSEMRGGTASCRLRISDSEILNPFFDNADVLIAMSQCALDSLKNQVAAGSIIVANSTLVSGEDIPEGVRYVEVPATALAAELKNPRGANIAMLGGAIAATNLFDVNAFADGIDSYFDAKGRNNPLNRECFVQGAQSIA